MKKLLTLTFAALSMLSLSEMAYAQQMKAKIKSDFPRLVLSREDINLMKENVAKGQEPWKSTWSAFKTELDKYVSESWKPVVYTGEDSYKFYTSMTRDGYAARDLAIGYHITGDKKYADKSLAILNKWLESDQFPGTTFDPEISYPNTGMMVARGVFPFQYTYDLLCADNLVDSKTKAQFEQWQRVLLPHIKEGARRWDASGYFDKQYYQNHIAADVMGLMSIAILLGDEELLQYAIDSPKNKRDAKELFAGMILMKGEKPYYREPVDIPVLDGEIIDRYRHFMIGGQYRDYVTSPNRALQYCGLSTTIMVIICEMGRLNGMDFYGYTAPGGENIKLPLNFYADFYIYKSSTIKSGFYSGEDSWINANDSATHSLWEVAYARYPGDKLFAEVLKTNKRGSQKLTLMGPVTLTHGRK